MAKIPKPASGQPKRIFLVEDHPVFRDGLAKLLNAENDLTVCGEAGDAKQPRLMLTWELTQPRRYSLARNCGLCRASDPSQTVGGTGQR